MTAENPEGWQDTTDQLRDALADARAEADEHAREYAAGMRLACSMIEAAVETGATPTTGDD